MRRFQTHCSGFVLLAVPVLVPLQSASAQQPRIRTLTYDADRGEWVERAAPRPGTLEGDLHAIRVLIKDGRHRKALSAIRKHEKKYGESHPLYPEVLIAKAEALIGRREYQKAHVTLQAFLTAYAVYRAYRARPCGSLFPNGWGLFDMHGNVAEWCEDSGVQSTRVGFGGAFRDLAERCGSSSRYRRGAPTRAMDMGFRVALVAWVSDVSTQEDGADSRGR